MRTASFIVLLILASSASHGQEPEAWYRVVSTEHKMWPVGINMFLTPLGGDSVHILGFSSHGASVHGTVKDGRIVVPRQTATIIPFGGGGKLQWDIIVEGHGTITDSIMVIACYFKHDNFEASGMVTAIRQNSPPETKGAGRRKKH